MNWTEILYPAVALVSAGSAALAWAAKLRWASEYKEATEQLIKAKEAEAAALKAELATVQSLNSDKILEHALTTKKGLEGIIRQNEAELAAARATIESLTVEVQSAQARITTTAETTALEPSSTAEMRLIQKAEHLAGQLKRAREEERALRIQQLNLQRRQLESSSELADSYAVEIAALETQRAEVLHAFDEARGSWLRDRQDAETKAKAHEIRATELRGQIANIRSLGPESNCPTCGCQVGNGLVRILDELEDQWASIVQDGKWWSARLAQLRETPEEIVSLERLLNDLSVQITTRMTLHASYRAAHVQMREIQAELDELLNEVTERD